MNRDQVEEIVRKAVKEFVHSHAPYETQVRDLYGYGETLADQIILDLFRETEPVPETKKPVRKTPRATSASVSAALGRYRDDEDGKPLGRAVVRRTRFGPVQYGGFKVSGTPNHVAVAWISPDDMNDQEVATEERVAMLTWYQDILVRAGYTVDWDGKEYNLTVSR